MLGKFRRSWESLEMFENVLESFGGVLEGLGEMGRVWESFGQACRVLDEFGRG